MARLIFALFAAAIFAAPCLASTETVAAGPNFVLIMVDDMGYSDPGFIGGDIDTPNIDRLAEEGVVFEQFYNNAKCSQTRASLLSGLYYQQAVQKGPSTNKGHDQLAQPNNVTLAEVLKDAGYATALAGKWHLGATPYERGFDKFYGLLDGAADHWFSPRVFGDFHVGPDDFYSSDAYTDAGLSFIEESLGSGKPFFLYLAYTAPHYPLHAHAEDIEKYRGRYSEGWDVLRERRLAHMKQAGFVDKNFAMNERLVARQAWDDEGDEWRWHELSAEEQAGQERLMETYAAMMDRVDQNIGRLLKRLEELDVVDDTIVFFLSDNGGSPYPNKDDPDTEPGPPGSWRTLNTPWAQVNSTPFSLFKRFSHEGGIATPMIAWWPKGVVEGGRRSVEPFHVIDFMPSLVELAAATYPDDRYGNPVLPLAGRSFAPVLQNRATTPGRKLFWEYARNYAMRHGDWKLVQSNLDSEWALYDMSGDRGETENLAKKQPDVLQGMVAEWTAWKATVDRQGAVTDSEPVRASSR
jgi:arylsulfatase